MKFRKILSASLVLSMCLSTACAQNTTESSTNSTTTTTTTAATTTTEQAATENTTDVVSPSDETPEIIGNYEWTPYVWNDTLTEMYGESCKQSTFNFIEAIMNGETTFECVEETDIYCIMSAALCVCPYAFKICGYNIGYKDGVGTITYIVTPEEAQQIIDDFARNCEEIINASVLESDSPEVKAMMIHYNFSKTLNYDYFLLNEEDIEPDPDDTSDHDDVSAYRAIVDREGICQSFAMALVHLYLQCGLEANIAGGSSPKMAHMWVYMELDGEKIFIDPTWEDTHNGTGLSFFGIDSSVYSANEYDIDPYLLLSAETYDTNFTSEKYKPLWGMQAINSITRENSELVIDYVDANGADAVYVVSN